MIMNTRSLHLIYSKKNLKKNLNRGFSFVELIIGIAVFTVIVVSVYGAYQSIFNVVYTSRAKLDAVDLIDEQLEIIRNMPYSQVGIANGIPAGVLSHIQTIVRDSNAFTVTTYVRNVDDPFDGKLGSSPNDLSPADHKLVEIDITCAGCRHFIPVVVTTTVSPKALETASTNGALFIKVFDADGDAIKDAAVHILNSSVTPNIVVDDVTDATGMLEIVDVKPGVNTYQISVTKSGYSTDATASSTGGNPNPTKPNATIAIQQVTSISFSIDQLSAIDLSSVTSTCTPVAGMDFQLKGSKLVGTPSVYKYTQNKVTGGGGLLNIPNLEWDSYTIAGTDAAYDIIGTNPLSPVNLVPNSSQNIQLIVAPKNPNTLLVTVRNGSASAGPLSGVTVSLGRAGATTTQTTGVGVLTQSDWSLGAGQATSTIPTTQYFSTDGNIETNLPVGDMKLKKIFSGSPNYVAAGTLTSSSFDTGSNATNYQTITWLPGSQPFATGASSVGLQLATNTDGGTWNFVGPDGTASTYYTTSNQNIWSGASGFRYLRYKVFESTASTTLTPSVSDVSFTYTSDCIPPGQVTFSGLTAGTYTLQLSKTGYTTVYKTVTVGAGWQSQDVPLIAN